LKSENIKISVVSPVYKAEKMIDELCSRLINNLSKITDEFEIILIDDFSPDNSWNKIKAYTKKDKRIKAYQLSRNFGQHHAITAGIDKTKGDWTIVMDCDLQDRPEEIIRLYNKAIEGFDIVLAARKNRKDNFLKKATSKLFYLILSFLSGMEFNGEVGNFGIYHKNVVDNIKDLREPFRFFVSSVKWLGFNSTTLNVEHDNRFEGKSTYNYKKLISLGVNIIISYSNKPLKMMIFTGISFAFISLLFIAYNFYLKFIGQITELGYTSVISSIWLLAGVILSSTGILGIYIGKIYDGIKNRPLYIISEKTTNE
jgi:polyisoprenyl-phosphate glycosyltransferase